MADVRRVADGLDIAVAQGAHQPMTRSPQLVADETGIAQSMLGEVGVALGSEVEPEVLSAAQGIGTLSTNAARSDMRCAW